MTDYVLRVALWQIPTMVINTNKPAPERESSMLTMNALNTVGAQDRCRLLEEQVGNAVAAFSQRPPHGAERAIDLFVAPEYLFARSDREHFHDVATKDVLCRTLEGLSQRYPSVLLVPGSIAWKQPGIRSNFVARLFMPNRGKRAERTRASARGGIQAHETAALTAARGDGAQYWLGRNTVYVYRAGKRIIKYDKRNDGSEVSAGDGARVYFAPGESESYFTVDGFEFSLQICAEHGNKPARSADTQIVISSSHPLKVASGHVRQGGYLLHADAILKPTAMHFDQGAWAEVTAQAKAAASPLTKAEIADRARRALDAMPATVNKAKGDKTMDDAIARRLSTAATQLGGEVSYYALTYSK